MKAILASLALAGSLLVAGAPAASAAPTAPVPVSIFPDGFVSVGVGSGGGYYAPTGYYTPRPYWGIVAYRAETRTVLAGYDAWGRPFYTAQTVSVPVYGWIHPAPRYVRYSPRPRVHLGLGFRFRL